ncbi:MAG: 6,7-dimethyl-8-ribityllumazine synthase [Chitinophagia bacterium]|jgi:6,7-dimethyl-8-ribityllumazine synthase|nr:6,7-dimethyl-8-ribityllumazine synthase [Chitinophagia bacterium]
MATQGNIALHKGIPSLADAFIVIVKTEWNASIVDKLEKGARKILRQAGCNIRTLTVPGAVEIPFAIKNHYTYCTRIPDAYIALGTVIQGDTPHFEFVCRSVTDGITQLNLSLDVPVIFGVLTLLNEEQAKERTTGKHGNKGEESAITALKMITLNRSLKK